MYNVAPYIERCVKSLEHQDIPIDNFEIICINDGSPDNSSEIVKSLQAQYSNIHLIDQENQGVSRARNNGIDCATGEYILFIDPDDYVDTNSFARILRVAEDKNAQVFFLGYTFLDEDGNIKCQRFNELAQDKIYSGIEAYFVSRGDGRTDPDRMVAILFETNFLNTHCLRFLPDMPYLEDGELISRILCLAERCFFYGGSFYQRTTRPGSATNSRLFYSLSAINGFVNAAVNLQEFRNQTSLSLTQKEFLNQPIVKFVILSVTAATRSMRLNPFLSVISTLKKNSLEVLELDGCVLFYKKLGRLYNLTPYLLYLYLVVKAGIRFIKSFKPRRLKSKIDRAGIL